MLRQLVFEVYSNDVPVKQLELSLQDFGYTGIDLQSAYYKIFLFLILEIKVQYDYKNKLAEPVKREDLLDYFDFYLSEAFSDESMEPIFSSSDESTKRLIYAYLHNLVDLGNIAVNFDNVLRDIDNKTFTTHMSVIKELVLNYIHIEPLDKMWCMKYYPVHIKIESNTNPINIDTWFNIICRQTLRSGVTTSIGIRFSYGDWVNLMNFINNKINYYKEYKKNQDLFNKVNKDLQNAMGIPNSFIIGDLDPTPFVVNSDSTTPYKATFRHGSPFDSTAGFINPNEPVIFVGDYEENKDE